MTLFSIKHNPGILSDEDLIRGFVVRQHHLELILETIRENTALANQHILIVGPRGSGKTTLVHRVAAEIRTKPELARQFYPLVFAEESYQVSSAGEFWLEALFHLSDQTQVPRWQKAYEELLEESDEKRLQNRALAQLMDFADEQGKRIVLIVENLNMLIGQQLETHADWELRHTLLNESRLMLLGTATAHFDEVKNIDKACFELFAIHELEPLDREGCWVLWDAVTGDKLSKTAIQPIQILTGGNPRLLTILAGFAAKKSLHELMDHLVQLIDKHTDYFKSQLEALAPIERKVFVALLDIWDPVGAREVAKRARLDVSKASVLLNRLVSRGAVQILEQQGRRRFYQVAERLYNIYYLMRRRAHPTNRVRAVVKFMVQFYEGAKLIEATKMLAMEACQLRPELSEDHFWVYDGIIKNIQDDRLKSEIVQATPDAFFDAPDLPNSIRQLVEAVKTTPAQMLQQAINGVIEAITEDITYERSIEQARQILQKAVALEPENATVWFSSGLIMFLILLRLETEQTCQGIIEQYEEVEKDYRKAIELEPDYAWAWAWLGRLLHEKLERFEEAERAYRKAIELEPDYAWAWAWLGRLLHEKLERFEEAGRAYRKAIELEPDYAWIWWLLGWLLHSKLEHFEEAEQAYRKAIELGLDYAWTWTLLGQLLHEKLKRFEEAEQAYRKAIDLQPDFVDAWAMLAKLILENGDTPYDLIAQALEHLQEPEDQRLFLGIISWTVYETNSINYLPDAERWAREALEKTGYHWNVAYALASIQTARGKWQEALEQTKRLLTETKLHDGPMQAVTELLISATAAGHGKAALKILAQSEAADALEPLIVGIKIHLNETPRVAQEIFEVGQDVAQRIRKQQDNMLIESEGLDPDPAPVWECVAGRSSVLNSDLANDEEM